MLVKEDKYKNWRRKNRKVIKKLVRWIKSPTKVIMVEMSDVEFPFSSVILDSIKNHFRQGYRNKKYWKKFLIAKGVDLSLFTPASTNHPDFA